MKLLHSLTLYLAAITVAAPARGDAIADRLAAIEAWQRHAQAVAPELAPPSTAPSTQPVAVTTLAEARAAIDAGATTLLARSLVIRNDSLDLRGATLKQSDAAVTSEALILAVGKVSISNGTLAPRADTGPAVFVSRDRDAAKTSDVTVDNVTLAAGGYGLFQNNDGSLAATRCRATTFGHYLYFGAGGSYVHMADCTSGPGSTIETTFRVGQGRYLLERSELTQAIAGGKTAVVRGDAAPYPDGRPGGVIVGCTLRGNVTPGPLTEDDGGQCMGIDRFVGTDGREVRLDAIGRARALLQTPLLLAAGKTREQIVAANAGTLSIDVARTLAARQAALDLRSSVQVVDTQIDGEIRYVARGTTTFERCRGNATFIATPAYPQLPERRLSAGETVTAGGMTFTGCAFGNLKPAAGLPVVIR